MIFGEGKDEEIKKYVDGVFAKVGFQATIFVSLSVQYVNLQTHVPHK